MGNRIEDDATTVESLDPSEFVTILSRELEPSRTATIGLDTRLLDDLQFDSLQMFLAIEVIAEMAGREAPDLPIGEMERLLTVRDLYLLYAAVASMPPHAKNPDQIGSVGSVSLRGSLVQLVAPRPDHFAGLYEIATSDQIAWRWRYNGVIPTYEEFVRTFNNGVLSQLVVTQPGKGIAKGLVVAYNANFQNGNASLAALVAEDLMHTGAGIEAANLFLRYAFQTWDLHKCYLELPEFNAEQFASGIGGIMHKEGRLRDHHYYAGRRWDQIILAIYRDEFLEWTARGGAAMLVRRRPNSIG